MTVRPVAAVCVVLALSTAAAQQPVFRSSTHFVRVDAYPRTPDGKIIEGLTDNDFEILEDGKPQQIATFDFIAFDHWTPEEQRLKPSSPEASYDLAADPRYRVFVIVMGGGPRRVRTSGVEVDVTPDPGMKANVRNAIRAFLERNLGPHDLFAVLHPTSAATSLMLTQQLGAFDDQLDDPRDENVGAEERIMMLMSCGIPRIVERARADLAYSLLERVIRELGVIREERKSIIFVGSGLSRATPDTAAITQLAAHFPTYGISNGRIGGTDGSGGGVSTACAQELHRLAYMDFERRFRDLLDLARENNVAFYPVSDEGLMTPTTLRGGRGTAVDMHPIDALTDTLRTLASETGGIAVVNTNDVGPGVQRIADALDAYYVLGYYTTNSKADGRLRRITVRLKPSGRVIPARNQYRAPAEAGTRALAAASTPTPPRPMTAEETALAELDRRRAPVQFAAYAARGADDVRVVVEVPEDAIAAGRWRGGANVMAIAEDRNGQGVQSVEGRLTGGHAVLAMPVAPDVPLRGVIVRLHADGESLIDTARLPHAPALVGDPLVYRAGERALSEPIAIHTFTHGDRARLEWPTLRPLSSESVRLLDRAGKPLKMRIAVIASGSPQMLSAEFPIAPLGRGDYLVELTVSSQGATERRLLAFRVR